MGEINLEQKNKGINWNKSILLFWHQPFFIWIVNPCLTTYLVLFTASNIFIRDLELDIASDVGFLL